MAYQPAIRGDFTELTGLTAAALNADLVPSTDVSGYKWFCLQITGTWTGTLTAQASNDNATFQTVALQTVTSTSASWVASVTTNNIVYAPVNFKYLRVRMTAYTSGTAAGAVQFHALPGVTQTQGVVASQGGTWTVGSNSATGATVPANAFYVGATNGSGNLTGLVMTTPGDASANSGSSLLAQARAMIYNGATWDLSRGNVNTTTGDTGTKTASFTGATQTNYNATGAYITIILGTVSGTTPTFTAQLQWSPDGGTTWVTLGAAMTALTATGNTGVFAIYPGVSGVTTGGTQTVSINAALPRTWRINYTIGGTTPSFVVSSVQVNYIL